MQKYICGNSAFTAVHQAPSSNHSGGVNLARVDGSTSFVSDTIDFTVWQAFGSRSGEEAVEIP